jgi:DNA ligase 1
MALLALLVAASKRVAETASRTAKIRELAACLRDLDDHELELGVLYLAGETRQGRSGIGYASLRAASEVRPADAATLEIREVDERLEHVATIRGTGATARRNEALRELFARATHDEQHFLMRLIAGELRQGALAGVMIDALAAALDVPVSAMRRAAMYASNLGVLARVGRLERVDGLAKFQLQVMSPVAPMLAQTANDVEEALEACGGEAAFEWKMDGARIQVHKLNELVRVFTRSSNEVTSAIPEIVAAARRLPARALVLDGDAIALTATGRPHPFQTTMRRFGRKLEVEQLQAEIPMQAFYFDCLHLEGRSIAECSTRERFAALASVVPAEQLIPRLVTHSLNEAQAFLDAALAQGHEGVMAKALEAPYEAGNRGASWLKIKRAHTLDLVVLAAEWGHGRRAGKLSNLHLGARDESSGEYVMLGKTFKGLTDAMLEWQTKEFLARAVPRDPGGDVDPNTVYVRPEIVVEVAFSDLQASSRYSGGLALRLARVKRYRPDKRADEADTMTTVRKIFDGQ